MAQFRMTNWQTQRIWWLGSVRTRVAILASLVIALLIGCGFAFVLILQNRQSAVTGDTQRRLSALAVTMVRDYSSHEEFQTQHREFPPLENPDASGSDDVLSLMTTVVLKNELGTEGGFYSKASDRLLGYAYPTHEGPGVKRDIPPIERPMIEDVARRAASQGQEVSNIYRGERAVIVFEAVPIVVKGNPIGSAWVMKRLPSLRSQDWTLSLGAAAFVALSLLCVLLAFLVARDLGSGVSQIEERLHELDRDFSSSAKPFSGLAELARIYQGVNQLAESLRQKIEQERDLREQLRHKERLAALGQVAAGVAHELRNPLATIRLRTQMNQRAVSDSAVQQSCSMVLEEIDRLNGIVERLLYFSRPLNLKVELFDLVSLVKDCIDAKATMVRSESIRFVFDATGAPVMIRGDRSKLYQVFDNILSNAIDALGMVGTVELRVLDKNGYVTVECSDDGHGIPEEIRDKLFDPFFTTRPKGIGLGLSIAYEIVQAHEGTTEITSSPTKGTIVTVRLPAAGPGTSCSGVETIEIDNA
jgi:two-component system, NtrC family, sensor histidine kinase HydH